MPIEMNFALSRTLSVLAILCTNPGCVDSANSPETAPTPPSLASTPQLKAAMELGSAQTLEKSRKTKKAVEAYRRIIKQYPATSQAEIAREKLQSLEHK